MSIRFDCRQAPRTAGRKRRGAEALPEPDPRTGRLREEKELEHLKERHPAEFAELYREALSKAPPWVPEGFKRVGAEGSALMQLKEKYGVVK